MGIQIQQTVFETLEPGEYPAQVAEIEAVEGQFGPQLRWKFNTDDGHTLSAWSSQTFSPKSKLYKWTAAALGGRDIPAGVAFDSDAVIGRRVRLIVVTQAGKEGDYNRVSEVLPPKRPAPMAPNGNGTRQQQPAAQPAYSPDEPPDWPGWDDEEPAPF